MSTQGKSDQTFEFLVKDLEEFCDGQDGRPLSLEALREKVASIPPAALRSSSFFHLLCDNELVTLEIVQFVLEVYTDAASWTTSYFDGRHLGESVRRSRRRRLFYRRHMGRDSAYAYPLHLACTNEQCPDSVIKLLVEKNSAALGHLCVVGEGVADHSDEYSGRDGLPLHYYLSRCSNINLDMAKMLVDASLEALDARGVDWPSFLPITHTIVGNPRVNDLSGVLEYIGSVNPDSLRLTTENKWTPLHVALQNKDIGIESVRLLLEFWPESIRKPDYMGLLPVHNLCDNHQMNDAESLRILTLLTLLVDGDPQSVMGPDSPGDLPIHLAVGHKSFEFCKILIDAYPASLRIHSADGQFKGTLPIHLASSAAETRLIKYILSRDPECASMGTYYGDLPLHCACRGSYVNSGRYRFDATVLKLLLDAYPEAIFERNSRGQSPIHIASETADARLIEWLLLHDPDGPESIRRRDSEGCLPIHSLCANYQINDAESQRTLTLLVNTDPQSVMEPDDSGRLPIHWAVCRKSPEFCKILIDAYPSSLRIEANDGKLPIHIALKETNVRMIKFLLLRDPECASKAAGQHHDWPLHLACESHFKDVTAAKLLFDAYPDAIFERNNRGKTPLGIARELRDSEWPRVSEKVLFLETQLPHARMAQDSRAMTTRDRNGRLPLHNALHGNASLGAIKLLVRGNPAALGVADNGGLLPLHIACKLGAVDVVKYLSEERPAAVSERNCNGELPLHLLCLHDGETGKNESTEYVEAVWCLLRACPETVSGFV